jgi:hypothetical protein
MMIFKQCWYDAVVNVINLWDDFIFIYIFFINIVIIIDMVLNSIELISLINLNN